MIIHLLILSIVCLFTFASSFAEQPSDPQINEILIYWFGDLKTPEDYPRKHSKIWFDGGIDVDHEIQNRFGHLVQDAANHKLDEWKKTPKGRLALILLLDQFSRNIYRGTPYAFAFDSLAQELTLEGLDVLDDQKLF